MSGPYEDPMQGSVGTHIACTFRTSHCNEYSENLNCGPGTTVSFNRTLVDQIECALTGGGDSCSGDHLCYFEGLH